MNSISMTRFAATVSDCIGIEAPKAAGKKFDFLRDLMNKRGMNNAEKLLIYNPDAVGMWLFAKYTEWFAPVLENTQIGVPVCTVLPSVTPVCFGTMYTGVLPEVHGITRYEKKVLEQESFFDCLVKAGKKTAIVAVENSSMAIIYDGKAGIDYYKTPYDKEATEKAKELLENSDYDVIVVYNQEYDDVMHKTYPESEISLAALKHHIAAFGELAEQAEKCWKKYDSVIVWATDHGIHTNDEGHGTHGSDMDEDLSVMHFFGAYPAEK